LPGAPEQYMGTFGHEIPGTQHRTVHPGTGRDLPDRAESEVLVRGYNLMRGPVQTRGVRVFDPDGWNRTGYRGHFREGWFFSQGGKPI
jgi:long-subunit acyl-CoA synthetase (AMP-forming)